MNETIPLTYVVEDQGRGKTVLVIVCNEDLEKEPIFIDSNTIQLTIKD